MRLRVFVLNAIGDDQHRCDPSSFNLPALSTGNHKEFWPALPVDRYEQNLERLVERLEKTGAKLAWRNTTPVLEGADGRVSADPVTYNESAARVMEKHEIQIHDLYSCAKKHEKEIQRAKNVHYTGEGSKLLAEQVAEVINAALVDYEVEE